MLAAVMAAIVPASPVIPADVRAVEETSRRLSSVWPGFKGGHGGGDAIHMRVLGGGFGGAGDWGGGRGGMGGAGGDLGGEGGMGGNGGAMGGGEGKGGGEGCGGSGEGGGGEGGDGAAGGNGGDAGGCGGKGGRGGGHIKLLIVPLMLEERSHGGITLIFTDSGSQAVAPVASWLSLSSTHEVGSRFGCRRLVNSSYETTWSYVPRVSRSSALPLGR